LPGWRKNWPMLRRNKRIGRPLGDRALKDAISRHLGRTVAPGKRRPKPKRERDGGSCGREVKEGELGVCHLTGFAFAIYERMT
jgi:hypothetical protein